MNLLTAALVALSLAAPPQPLLRGSVVPKGGTARVNLDQLAADLGVSVRAFGAKGDCKTDDRDAWQKAVNAAAGGRRVNVPPPEGSCYLLKGTVSVPSGVHLAGIGPGLVEVRVPAASTFRVFDIDGGARVKVAGFRFTKADGAALAGTAYAVSIRGAAADVVIEDCEAVGFVRGFNVAGAEGTTPGTVTRVTFRRVVSDASPTEFGYNVDDADGVLFDDSHAAGNWLDGFKLRKKALNVTVRGGSARGNGVGYLTNASLYAGDGLDAYAGGDTFVIDGWVAEGNYGNGLTVKTGDLNQTDPTGYGYVRNVQLVGVRARYNLNGSGLYLTVSNPTDMAEPLVNAVSVVGGVFQGNSSDGVYVNARNVSIVGPLVRDNQRNGITTGARALDVEILSPVVIANSRGAANGYDAVSLDGTRVRVVGGTYVGVDADTVAGDGDYAALTKWHRNAVRVSANAVDVEVDVGSATYSGQSQAVRCDATSGKCLTRQRGAGVPSAGVYGSVGSTWTRTDASAPEDVLWVKASGAPNAPTAGWQRAFESSSVQAITSAVSLTASSPRTVVMGSGASIGVDRTVTLPASGQYAGMQFRIVRTAAATGAGSLIVAASANKNLAAGTWCDVAYDGAAWVVVGYGAL